MYGEMQDINKHSKSTPLAGWIILSWQIWRNFYHRLRNGIADPYG